MSDDLNIKVAVIENELENLKQITKEREIRERETHSMLLDIKSRIDKQNGTLPHMAEDIKSLHTKVDQLAIQTNKKIFQIERTTEKLGWKTKVGIGTFMAFIGALIEFIHRVYS